MRKNLAASRGSSGDRGTAAAGGAGGSNWGCTGPIAKASPSPLDRFFEEKSAFPTY